MHLLHAGAVTGMAPVQWICGPGVLALALPAAHALRATHHVGVDLWRMDDWDAWIREGIARELDWLQGRSEAIGSRFETALATTQGPILAIDHQPRGTLEMLRAFVPGGRGYLSLAAPTSGQIEQAALRLLERERAAWSRLAVD